MEQLYWRNRKLDYLDQVIEAIDDAQKLGEIVKLMSRNQIKATFKELEDPYSSFNYGREYSSYYWERFKQAL